MVLTRTLLQEHNPNHELLATGSSLGYESLLSASGGSRGLFSFVLSSKTDKRVPFPLERSGHADHDSENH